MASRAIIDKIKTGFLQTMADNHTFNKKSMSLFEIAQGCGYASNNNKTFKLAYKELKEEGIVTKSQGGVVEMTPKGVKDYMPKPRPPPSNEEIQEKQLSRTLAMKEKDKNFPNQEKTTTIFKCLLDGEAHSKDELATIAGWAGTNNKGLKTLMKFFKDKELTENVGKGLVKFTDQLFPNGRPDRSNNKRKADEISDGSERSELHGVLHVSEPCQGFSKAKHGGDADRSNNKRKADEISDGSEGSELYGVLHVSEPCQGFSKAKHGGDE